MSIQPKHGGPRPAISQTDGRTIGKMTNPKPINTKFEGVDLAEGKRRHGRGFSEHLRELLKADLFVSPEVENEIRYIAEYGECTAPVAMMPELIRMKIIGVNLVRNAQEWVAIRDGGK